MTVGPAVQMVREALRALRRAPGGLRLAFCVLTLAVSVAVCTLAVVDHLVLRSLPYAKPEHLVAIVQPGQSPGTFGSLSPGLFHDIASGSTGLTAVGAVRSVAPTRMHGRESEAGDQLVTRQVSPELLSLLGVRLALGRIFTVADLEDDAPPVAIVTASAWRKRWGSDPHVVGSSIASAGGPITVIGVLSDGVRYPIATDAAVEVLLPLKLSDRQKASRNVSYLSVVGRVRDGVAFESVSTDLLRFGQVTVVPLAELATGAIGARLKLLLLGVGLLLTIACTSVAIALVVWARRRVTDFAVRAALGADLRWVAGSVFVEAVVLMLGATVLGLVGGHFLLELVSSELPAEFGNLADVQVDRRVAFLAVSSALVCGSLIGLAPGGLVRSAKGALSGRTGTSPVGERRGLSLVMVASSAVLFVLLATAALAISTLVSLTAADMGFDREDVLSTSYGLPESVGRVEALALDSPERARVAQSYREQILSSTLAVPGVVKAAVANGSAPLQRSGTRYGVSLWGGKPLPQEMWPDTTFVSSDYFDVLAIRTRSGRTFSASDRDLPLPPIVLNESAAIALFGTADAVGRELDFQGRSIVVGIVHDVHMSGPEVAPRPALYAMFERFPFAIDSGSIFVKTASPPASVWPTLSRTVLDQVGVELSTPTQLEDRFDEILAVRRFSARVLGVFGAAAIIIGGLAVFAVMALIVSGRQHRFAVEIAIGASPGRICWSTLRDALVPTAAGTILGLFVFIQLQNLVSALVFDLSPTDPYLLTMAGTVVLTASVLAAWIPASRASKADPLKLLRA